MSKNIIESVKSGDVSRVVEALKNNDNIDEADEEGINPLLHAAMGGNAAIVALLLTHGANPFFNNLQGENSVTMAAYYDHTEIVTMLREVGVPLTFMAASLLGDISTIERLVSHDADLINKQGTRALLWAAEKGQIDTVLALVRLGADLNAKDEFGSALAHAALNGHYELVKTLIELGMDVNSNTAFGSPLMLAAGRTHADIVRLLIANGADVNATDTVGDTALIEAASFGYADIAEILLSNHADCSMKNAWGKNALMYAKGNKHKDIVKLININLHDM